MIRVKKIPFRHNWETVITPVVDYLTTLPQVNPEKIGLLGYSMGGYLAPRAAAFEHRLAWGSGRFRCLQRLRRTHDQIPPGSKRKAWE